jgi:DNA helicase TIP49 (TBP-interacting protein)
LAAARVGGRQRLNKTMIQVMKTQNVKVEVSEFEQMKEIVNELTLSDFNVSATIQGENWLVVADREIQPPMQGFRANWSSSGVYSDSEQKQ